MKAHCLLLNLTKIIPTCLDLKSPDKSSLIDLLFSFYFSISAVFVNDLIDYCVVGAMRNTKISLLKHHIITKRNLKLFSEKFQGFFSFSCHIDNISLAWKYFQESFISFADKFLLGQCERLGQPLVQF